MDAVTTQLLAAAVRDITDARNSVSRNGNRLIIVQELNQALTRLAVVEARLTGETTITGISLD